jgi:hypothetical protein
MTLKEYFKKDIYYGFNIHGSNNSDDIKKFMSIYSSYDSDYIILFYFPYFNQKKSYVYIKIYSFKLYTLVVKNILVRYKLSEDNFEE